MRIGVIGINYKLADLKLREKLAKSCLKYFSANGVIQHPLHFVTLSTCNRTEIYFSSKDLAESHTYILGILREDVSEEFDQKLYSYFGKDCFLHLCRVTAGLDSAIVAETEIQGQVKAAYEYALEFSALTEELHYLFQKSLKTGKLARSQLPLQRGLPDLEHAIVQTGQHFFSNNTEIKLLFVGASDINRKILHFCKAKHYQNISICNRTPGLALEISNHFNCSLVPWQNLEKTWYTFDWIIFATKSPNPLIHKNTLPNELKSKKLIIDLSVPRNVDAKLAKEPDITLLNIDQIDKTLLTRLKQIEHLLVQTESLIENAVNQHFQSFILRQIQKELWLAAV